MAGFIKVCLLLAISSLVFIKLVYGYPDGALVGPVIFWAVFFVELIAALFLISGYDRFSCLIIISIALTGCVISLASPAGNCGCLGGAARFSRSGHVASACTLGALAVSLLIINNKKKSIWLLGRKEKR